MSESIELKGCPFCGGKAEFCQTDIFWVRCENIECYSESGIGVEGEKDQAAELWNNRSDGWISVDERLPSVGGAYWTFNGGDTHKTVIQQRVHMYDLYSKQFNSGSVTHWMLLPQPPKAK